MRSGSFWALALTLACSNTPDDAGTGGGGPSAGSGGGSLAGSNSGGAGQSSGGSNVGAGGLPTGGVSQAGTSSVSGGAGTGSGGRANGGGGGGGAKGGAGGASGGAGGGSSGGGAGGTGACVKNLACKLSPPPTTGDIYQDCVDRINQFLTQCACLPPLERRKDGEACADQMAEYDAMKNTAHAGHSDKICTPSGAQNECPGYSSNAQVIGLCMQQMWDEGPPPTDPCTGECFQTYGHFINMTDPGVKKVACGFYTTASGKVWSVQNFTR